MQRDELFFNRRSGGGLWHKDTRFLSIDLDRNHSVRRCYVSIKARCFPLERYRLGVFTHYMALHMY